LGCARWPAIRCIACCSRRFVFDGVQTRGDPAGSNWRRSDRIVVARSMQGDGFTLVLMSDPARAGPTALPAFVSTKFALPCGGEGVRGEGAPLRPIRPVPSGWWMKTISSGAARSEIAAGGRRSFRLARSGRGTSSARAKREFPRLTTTEALFPFPISAARNGIPICGRGRQIRQRLFGLPTRLGWRSPILANPIAKSGDHQLACHASIAIDLHDQGPGRYRRRSAGTSAASRTRFGPNC